MASRERKCALDCNTNVINKYTLFHLTKFCECLIKSIIVIYCYELPLETYIEFLSRLLSLNSNANNYLLRLMFCLKLCLENVCLVCNVQQRQSCSWAPPTGLSPSNKQFVVFVLLLCIRVISLCPGSGFLL